MSISTRLISWKEELIISGVLMRLLTPIRVRRYYIKHRFHRRLQLTSVQQNRIIYIYKLTIRLHVGICGNKKNKRKQH